MRVRTGVLTAVALAGMLGAAAQSGMAQDAASPQADAAPDSAAAEAPAAPVNNSASAAEKKTYTVPAGTKVLLQLRSAINTKSAKPGDGVYLASTFPVVVGNRVMIPAGVYVQGVVDRVARAGRVKGKAQLDMHFTSIIFPNGTVVEIPGLVNSLPGAKTASERRRRRDHRAGRRQGAQCRQRRRRSPSRPGEPSAPSAASAAGHPVAGGVIGLGAGLAATGLVSLFTRGADVNIDSGTQVEMVLQRPLVLEEENLRANGRAGDRSRSGSLGQPAQADGKTKTGPGAVPTRRPRLRVI